MFFNVNAILAQAKSNVEQEMRNCAEDLLSKSQELVPVGDTEVSRSGGVRHAGGSLKESGFVRQVKYVGADKVGFDVVYDTRKTDPGSARKNFNYAIKVHETPQSYKQGTWKFLELPYKENAHLYQARIMAAGARAISSTGGWSAGNNGRSFDE